MIYKNTKSTRILNQYGADRIRTVWEKKGYEKSAEYFGTTVAVIRSIVKDKQWKRSVAYTPNILKSIRSGAKSVKDYPHIEFDEKLLESDKNIAQPVFLNEALEIWAKANVDNSDTGADERITLQITLNNNSKRGNNE